MFGSGLTIRNWSPEQKTSKTPTHVNVYDAVQTKNGPSGLDREGMILVALMSGGDYIPEGIPGCGPKTACEAARAGFGRDLCKIARNDSRAMQEWRERLQHEIKTNESKLFNRKRPSMKIPDDFPRPDILGYYTHPAISSEAGLDKLRRTIRWDQELDFPGLRSFTCDAFDWVKLEGAKHFIRSLAPSLLVRHLRKRGEETDRFPSHNVEAIQEDEALLVDAIHGKRQHAITDSTTELRVSFTPLKLVTIDLSQEEPDEEPDAHNADILNSQAPEADLDEELPIEIDDDAEAGPKKRGPTKFDPNKPARVWVLETYVKVGVPLKVQDWEATRQKPLKAKRTATTDGTGKTAPKAKGARGTKAAGGAAQSSIARFAKVTKPAVKVPQALSKTHNMPTGPLALSQPASQSKKTVVEIFSSSPVRPVSTVPHEPAREKSLSPVQEDLPSSVMKRRRRAPIQRSRTLPSDLTAPPHRSAFPTLDTIETLDLVEPSPSPSRLPAKKARSRATRQPPVPWQPRGTSVMSTPGKTRQTTLDAWRSPTADSPTRPRRTSPPVLAAPIQPPSELQRQRDGVETLDLTLSSPLQPLPAAKPTAPADPRRTNRPTSNSRPPLVSISSNAPQLSSTSSTSTSSKKPSKPTSQPTLSTTRRASPRLSKTKSASPQIESLDLTTLSSPVHTSTQPAPPASSTPLSIDLPSPQPPCRRSPRNHTPTSPSPPAAWKAQAKKKREIILRKSLAGAWTFIDTDSPSRAEASEVAKRSEKERRRWRESEIEVLDLS